MLPVESENPIGLISNKISFFSSFFFEIFCGLQLGFYNFKVTNMYKYIVQYILKCNILC